MSFLFANSLVILSTVLVINAFKLGHLFSSSNSSPELIIAVCAAWGLSGSYLLLALSRAISKLNFSIELIQLGGPGDWVLREVHALAQKRGILTPEVGVYQSREVGAFASGSSQGNSIISFSTGLLERMDRDQVRAVMAHEINHIANGDMISMALIQGAVNSYILIGARIISGLILKNDPHAASLVFTLMFEALFGIAGLALFCWYSRRRELLADLGGARLVGFDQMISAIRAIESKLLFLEPSVRLAPSFKFISRGELFGLFYTHPSIHLRITELKKHSRASR